MTKAHYCVVQSQGGKRGLSMSSVVMGPIRQQMAKGVAEDERAT
jgi:hypothetical protein